MWVDGTTGIPRDGLGIVSAANSLIGTIDGDRAGSEGIVPLTNGNYVAISGNLTNIFGTFVTNAGAVTWGSGTAGQIGAITNPNSLVGASLDDFVGTAPYLGQPSFPRASSVLALPNGNYVVGSPNWDFIDVS